MSAKDLAKAVAQRFAGMSKRDGIAKVHKLAGASAADAKFMRETFPELFREAFIPAGRVGARQQAGGVRGAR
jgi:hypothetical protein